MMVEDAIRSMNTFEEESSLSSDSCICNHLDCITERTHGENGSMGNSNLRMGKRKYVNEYRMNESFFFDDAESVPSELSLGHEKEFCIFECLGIQSRNTVVHGRCSEGDFE